MGDAMQIYELKGLRSAMGGWDFTIETDAGRFQLATDRPYRAATLGALLVRRVEGYGKDDLEEGEYGPRRVGEDKWEAWVFDIRLNAMVIRELHKVWDDDEKKEREWDEDTPIPTLEEAKRICRQEGVPQAISDVKSVFRDCVEVGDDGEPLTGWKMSIEDFWRNGRFLICDDWRTRRDA